MLRNNIAIITSYNDMLSAYQPWGLSGHHSQSAAWRERGRPGRRRRSGDVRWRNAGTGWDGLSLLSREVIAMSAAIGLSHNMFDGALYLGVCDKIVPGLAMAAAVVRPPAVDLYSFRPDGQRPGE